MADPAAGASGAAVPAAGLVPAANPPAPAAPAPAAVAAGFNVVLIKKLYDDNDIDLYNHNDWNLGNQNTKQRIIANMPPDTADNISSVRSFGKKGRNIILNIFNNFGVAGAAGADDNLTAAAPELNDEKTKNLQQIVLSHLSAPDKDGFNDFKCNCHIGMPKDTIDDRMSSKIGNVESHIIRHILFSTIGNKVEDGLGLRKHLDPAGNNFEILIAQKDRLGKLNGNTLSANEAQNAVNSIDTSLKDELKKEILLPDFVSQDLLGYTKGLQVVPSKEDLIRLTQLYTTYYISRYYGKESKLNVGGYETLDLPTEYNADNKNKFYTGLKENDDNAFSTEAGNLTREDFRGVPQGRMQITDQKDSIKAVAAYSQLGILGLLEKMPKLDTTNTYNLSDGLNQIKKIVSILGSVPSTVTLPSNPEVVLFLMLILMLLKQFQFWMMLVKHN